MRVSGDMVKTAASFLTVVGAVIAVVSYADHLTERINRLEEQVHSLAASSAAEATRKSVGAVSPIQQECIALADEADSGQRTDGIMTKFGPEVQKTALTLMEKLGCGSMPR